MKIKTTADIQDIELPKCPDNLMVEMSERNIPADSTICKKCEWDKRCNEKWINFDDVLKYAQDIGNGKLHIDDMIRELSQSNPPSESAALKE